MCEVVRTFCGLAILAGVVVCATCIIGSHCLNRSMGSRRVLRMTELVTVAVIGAVGTVLAALVQSMRKENRNSDHAVVADSL
jgi:chromate transport protein ChrA